MKKSYLNSERNTALFSKPSKVFRLLMMFFIFIGINTTIQAQSGIYESFVIIDSGFGNNHYDLNPQTQTAYFDFNGTNLGTFNSTSTLILNGAQNKTFKCPGDNITQCFLFYRVYKIADVPPSFSSTGISFNSDISGAICSGGQNQIWESNGANINILNTLSSGSYIIEVFTNADYSYNYDSDFSTHYANNGTNNYKAQFTLDNPPIAVCKNHTAQLDATGNVTITASNIDGGSTDDIGIATLSASQTVFTCSDLGTKSITLTVTDSSGQTATCIALVTIEDNQAPALTCSANISVNNTVGTCGAVVTYTSPVGTDNCSGATTIQTAGLVSGATFPVGITTNTFEVTDAAGLKTSCSFTVTVIDNQAPALTCPANISVNNTVGTCGAAVTYTSPVGTDNCSGATTIQTAGLVSGATFPVGITTNTFEVTDAAGLKTSCSFTVTVIDNQAPALTCPANISVNNTVGTCGAVVTYTSPVGTDNCSGATTIQTAGLVSGATFPVGITTNTFEVTDAAGLKTSCSFTVTVIDNQAPALTCPANISVNNTVGTCGAVVTYTSPVGTDNCSGSTTIQTAGLVSGATFPVGITTNTFEVTDAAGLKTSCSFTVTVIDNQAPALTCPANISVNNTVGTCGAVVTYTSPVGTDNCSGATTIQTAGLVSGATFPVGITTNTFEVTDAAGLKTSCSFTVTVIDNQAPALTCPANISINNTVGTCGAIVTYTIPVGTDNCSGATTIQTAGLVSGATFPVGITTNTFEVTDAAGLKTSCSFTVTVIDNQAPALTCPANISINNTVGTCGAIVTYTIPVGTDNCSGATTIQTAGLVSGATFPVGITTNTFEVTDAAGLKTSCSFTVTVIDNQAPALTCPANISVNNTVGTCGAAVTYTSPVGTDNCSGVTTIQTAGLVSGATFPVGITTNTFEVTDAAGLKTSCSFTVTVIDNQAPTITCPVTATANTNNDGAGNCTTIVSLGTPTVSDNCTTSGNIIITAKVGGVTINPLTYPFGIGSTTVVWTATDQNGNVSMPCNQTVTVIDNENPTINCPANIQVATNTGCTATGVVLVTPVANDNCSVASVTNDAPAAFPLGNTTVTWTVTDGAGNTATCTQIVEVLDETLPTAKCKDISVNLNAAGTVSITAADINNNSTDNCGIASLVASKTTFNCSNIGANTVTLTVTDSSGNVSSCTATVTIFDVTPPVALCKPFTLNLNASGNATLLATNIDNGSSDNCSFTRTISMSSFNCSNLGDNTVTLTITDGSGNSSNCNATVTVVDPIAPVAQCKNFTLNLNAAGSATLLVTDIDNGSTDNCSIATRTVSPSSFTCANVGNNTVTLTVTDTSGNVATCTATVTIRDLIAPTALCKNISVNLDNAGSAVITPAMIDNGSSDNCGSVTLSLSKTSFDCSNLGANPITNTVTLTVTDTAGNSSNCTAIVTVIDVEKPVAICKPFTLIVNAATGTGVLNAIDINNGSSDNCGVVSYQISKDNSTFSNSLSYTCSDVGTKTVYLRVTDVAGNVSTSCSSTLTVESSLEITSARLEVCGLFFASDVIGGSGNYSYLWETISQPSSKQWWQNYRPFYCGWTNSQTTNCVNPPILNSINLAPGTYTIRLTVTDNINNTCKAIKTFTFNTSFLTTSTTTNDVEACKGDTVTYTSSKTNSGGVTYVYTWTINGGTYDPTTLNSNTVTVKWNTVGDGTSNNVTVRNEPQGVGGLCVSVEKYQVKVSDVPVPSFVNPITTVCPQSTQTYTLNNTFATHSWTVTGGTVISGGSSGNNSITIKWGNGATGTVSATVTNSVATGGCSATVSTNVAIEDPTPPTITCPANVTVNANTGLCYATGVNLGTPGTTDNCGVASVSNDAPATFPIGNTTVTWRATDFKGNYLTCQQTVTVVDNQFPEISCQANVSLVTAAASCAAFYDPNLPNYSDNSDSCTPPTNTLLTWTMTGANTVSGTGDIPNTGFNRGITTITYTVTDASLKTSSCSFTVTVTDNIPPTITCPSNINTTTNTACTATGVALGTPTTADNCSVVSVTNNAPVAFPIGTTTVTWTVTDVAGLTATCTQTVTVTDDDPPTISCPSNIATTTAVGVCTRLVNVPSPTTVDNCGTIAKLTWSMTGATTATSALTGINPIGNYTFNLGITTVQYTVTDSANNTANCSFTVTVNDNQPPVLSCPTNSTPLCADSTGKYTKTGTSWNATATDGCSTISSLTYTLTGSTTGSGTSLDGVAFNVGTTTVTWTATDTIGNTSNCTFAVNIIGLPSITTQPISQLDCEGSIVNFSVVATGTGLTYTWQRKLPTDASFITIPIESNVSYPSPGEIRLANVDSTLSPDGTQYQVIITNSSGCSITSAAATLSINKITTLLPIATAVTQCYGTNYSYTVSTSYPANVISYQWKSSVVSGVWNDVVNGTHFSGAQSAKLDILSGTPAESAEYRVYITFDASGADCNVNSSSRSRSITFLPELTPPVATITQPDCITLTGSVTLSGLPASGTWTLTRSGASSATTTGSGTSTIITGLAPGTYTYTVTLGTCTSEPSADVVIQAATTAIWNGSGWTNGPPAFNQALEFTGNYNSSGDLTACSCTVTNGAVLFNPNHTLKITNWVHVNGGSLTFEDTSSLVQTNNVVNIGNITYKRNTTKITKMDYTYWSSPVSPFTLGGVSPNTSGDKMYSYDSSIDNWKQESPSTSMVAGVGYIIRGPQNYVPPMPPSTYEAPFIGVPNNGHYEITGIIPDRSYLLGNPYPSALDADTFLDINQNVLDGTLYFWTHNTPIAVGTPDPGSGLYAYSGDDYASYNRTGGVSTAAPAPSSIPPFTGLNYNIPSGKIASGQGFFGGSKVSLSGTKIIFDNAMRVGVGAITGNNSQFFKTKTPKTLEKHRIWLNLTNVEGAFKQTLVGYVTDATNGYEDRFDGESFDGNDFLDFYSVNQDKNLTIQGRALPFDINDEIPLGYRVALDGTFTIKIGKTDGLLNNQTVFLEDKLNNSVFNLKEGNYTFTTTAGTFDDRFVLRYTDKTLGIEEVVLNDGIIVLYSNNFKTLIIRNNVKDATVNSVSLYNLVGQNIANWDVKGREQTLIQIPIKNLPSEIYIVKVKTNQGESSKKIIIK